MCGIFGAIGRNANPGIIRALALINRERGKQSIGFFSSNGKMIKSATDPAKALAYADFDRFICRDDQWFIAGHTRYATHGAKTNRNAHPFRFGRIIGSHNGVVDYPKDRNYQVDSEYLIDQINRNNGNYQAALADISGYWGLTWFDSEHFYISAHENTVYVARAADGVYYYSSAKDHLLACIGKTDKVECIEKGRTIRFSGSSPEFTDMPTFRSVAPVLEKRWWTGGATVTKVSSWPDGPYVPKMPPAPYNAPMTLKRDYRGRAEGYGSASQPEYADPFDSEDYPIAPWSAADDMDSDDLIIADEMSWELGYDSFDEYLSSNGFVGVRDLEDGLDAMDYDWCEMDDKRTNKSDNVEVVVDADIPF